MKRTPGWKATTRQSTLEPAVAFGLAVVLLFFVISGAVTYANLRTIGEDSDRIMHSHQVIVALDQVLSSAEDAETGQRGFLLTGSENYLEPYDNALANLGPELAVVARLTRGDLEQQQRLGVLQAHLTAKLAELKQTIALRRGHNLPAALAIVLTNRGKVEMDAIRGQWAAMARREESLRQQRVTEMARAHRTAVVITIVSGLAGIILTLIMGYLIGRTGHARKRQEWLQSGQVGLEAVMRGDQTAGELGRHILGFLAEYLGAVAGALYVAGGEGFSLVASHGVPGGGIPDHFEPGQGLMGEAAAGNRPIVVSDVPDGYFMFGSALGQSKPRHLVISPCAIDGKVNTIFELGFIHRFDDNVLALLAQMAAAVAIAVRSAQYRGDLRELLEDTQHKSEQLQVQGEELRVSNEELEEQSRALRESQSRLQQHQTELEQANSQLEEQAQQLEAQHSDLEKANATVQLRVRELEQASRYKSDFLANMSHELRTPLNSSLILARLLADNPLDNLTPEQVKYAQTIQSSGNDLLNLINDILDLSKIEAGHVDIRPETIAIERLIGNVRQTFQPMAQDKHLFLDFDIDAGAPRAITTDPHRLEQVLKNLLSNAIKFTEAGQVTVAIKPAAGGRVEFSVTDTGIGISDEQQQRIFEAFHQADASISRKYGGTGLGLSISRELTRLLGGTLHVRSTQGQGSSFTIIIPAIYDPALVAPRATAAAAAAAAAAASPASQPSRPPPPPAVRTAPRAADDRDDLDQSRRVLLVVEDDESFAVILRDMARDMGFQALMATTAEEALQLARNFVPSAVILDVGLPDQSGLAVLDRLKRDVQTRHIPIHVISASDHAQTALSLGAVGHLLKPVHRDQLIEVLNRLKARLAQRMHRVLIVEDDQLQREAVGKLLASHDTETVAAGTAAECLDLLKTQSFDCMVLDLSLPDASGYSLLETLSQGGAYSFPPVIVYTGRELSADDELRLRRYSKSIIIKGAKSPERLLDEVSLFLHQVVADLPDEHQKMIRRARNRDALLEGRRILVVEDDVRNVYALTNILEPRGAIVEIARNGQEAIDVLTKSAQHAALAIDLVLMDVMMPVMDGLTATRAIRQNPQWKKLPVIALTAKAMPDDQQRCIEAGANDYMAKPLDVEKLLSLVRVWMPR